MRIILLESVESLGGIGDIVNVRAGYGRNYLLPQGKAAPATEEQIAAFEERRTELLALEKERLAATAARAEQIRAALPLVVVANAGPAGKLYGSVGPAEISAGFAEAGIEVARAEIQMPEGPVKTLGEHRVVLRLRADVTEEITVSVVGQAGDVETLPGADALPSDEEGEAEDGRFEELARDDGAPPEAESAEEPVAAPADAANSAGDA